MEKKSLEEIRALLLNVDMVNGFVKEGTMADPYIQHIIEPQIILIEKYIKERDTLVAFIKEAHQKGCKEFKRYPEHCIVGTMEAELVDELKHYEKESLVYTKNSTSAIFARNFMTDIEKMKTHIIRYSKENSLQINVMSYSGQNDILTALKQADTYDIIFLDIYMESLNGIELARHIRKQGVKSRIIFFSNSE